MNREAGQKFGSALVGVGQKLDIQPASPGRAIERSMVHVAAVQAPVKTEAAGKEALTSF